MVTLPASVIVKVSSVRAAWGQLMRGETTLLEGATPARQREIVAGRVLARSVMTQMGRAESPVTQHPGGAPAWPFGLCGSIAHSATHVAVAIAPTSHVTSVGIDIEDGRNLGSAAKDIAIVDEIKDLVGHPFAGNSEGAVRLVFSAKEALFKCQSPLTGNTRLGFLDVRLHLAPSCVLRANPEATVERSVATVVARSSIIFQRKQGVTLAVAWIAA